MSNRELVPVYPPAPPPAPKHAYRLVGVLLLGLSLIASAAYLFTHRSAAPPPAAKVAVLAPQPVAAPQPAPLPVPKPVAQLEPPPAEKQGDAAIPVLPPPPRDDSLPPAQGPVPAPGWKLTPDEAQSLTTGSIGRRTLATYVNRDVDGFDYRTLKDTSLGECQRSCEADGNCQAYTFNTWRRVCFLKASVTVQRIEPRGVSGVKAGAGIRSARRPPTIERLPLRQFPGAPYRVVRPADFDGCARQCLAEPTCLGFNFDTAARSCGLIASLDRPVRNDLTVAGMKWQPPLFEISAKRRRGPAYRRDLPPDAVVIFDSVFGQFLR